MVNCSTIQHVPRLFSGPCERMRSEDYKVYVNGQEASVYTCRISAYPFNTVLSRRDCACHRWVRRCGALHKINRGTD